MSNKTIWICVAVLLLVAAMGSASALTKNEKLGKEIFFDKQLSINKNQACAACHAPEVGYTGPDYIINVMGSVYEGSVAGRFGNRKPPTAAYAGDSPNLSQDENTWIGGMFWDGRATGWTLGDPLAEQAKGPFLNPMEQGLPDAACVVYRVINSDYGDLYKQVWGEFMIKWPENVCSKKLTLLPETEDKVDEAYNNIARSIAAYERSKEVSSFTSKYDVYMKRNAQLSDQEGIDTVESMEESHKRNDRLSDQEKNGLDLFMGQKAKCANCHVPPLFTDFTYDNLGIPKNPMNPFYYEKMWNGLGGGINWIDPGLGGFLETINDDSAEDNYGKHKVPTLRNVDKRPYPEFIKAYGHNGYFKSLKQIVHFYNTRDVSGASWNGVPWPEPEVFENMNTDGMGNLGLSDSEEEDIVAFMKTLTDRNDHHNHDEDGQDD